MPQRLKVLIVDDDAIALEVAGAVLEARGYEVLQQSSALGTTRLILREQPRVVLLDVRMPGLSGDRLAELIAQGGENSPAIFLHSASPKAELERLARQCGAAGVVEKTGDPEEFMRRFERLLNALPPPSTSHEKEK